jgi:hypothetical protein
MRRREAPPILIYRFRSAAWAVRAARLGWSCEAIRGAVLADPMNRRVP